MSASLRLDQLACDRGGRRLFEGLSLSLAPGQAALVTGANGCGKSSLLRVIAGLLPAGAGQVVCEGQIALADEQLALDRDATLGKALRLWARLDGHGDANQALDAFALTHLAEVPVRMLSTGQRKRAVLARTLASGAAIWLLDEPGNGLDRVSLDALGAAVAGHLAEGGIAVIASHQPLDVPIVQEIAL